MSALEKIENAKKSSWVAEGMSDVEVNSIVELARISGKIERCRIDMGMTQKECAEYMGVSQGMISKWESREYNFTIKSLVEISQKINMTLSIDFVKNSPKQEYAIIKWDEDKSKKQQKVNFSWMNKRNIQGAIA